MQREQTARPAAPKTAFLPISDVERTADVAYWRCSFATAKTVQLSFDTATIEKGWRVSLVAR